VTAYYENLESHIQYETQDPSWASEAEDGIYTAMETEVFQGAEIVNVDCRSTLCRAEIYHISSDDLDIFNLEFRYKVSSTFSKRSPQHAELDDGRYKTTVYLAKNGNDLPTK